MNGEYIYLSGTENAIWFKKKATGKMNNKCKKNYFIYPTGIVAKLLDRNFLGIEIAQEYYKIACERLKQE